MTQQQIKDQDNEQNAAYADPATVAVTRIAETASEQEKQHDVANRPALRIAWKTRPRNRLLQSMI